MCGIAGIFGNLSKLTNDPVEVARSMGELVRHRGPDASEVWVHKGAGVAFSHTRLSILDLSEAGAQPMISRSGRLVITFNGEIYNHLDIRERLSGPWQGHSDTETFLEAIEVFGLEEALGLAEGMFAFAVFDHDEATVALGRDRFGEKPLYFRQRGSLVSFSSELPGVLLPWNDSPGINLSALRSYFRHSYIHSPSTIFEGVEKVRPGTIVRFGIGDSRKQVTTYYSPCELASESFVRSQYSKREELVDQLEIVLDDTVRKTMLSDVPLGAFLSGGVDSSLIVSSMVRNSDTPIRTFTIGFHDAEFNEADFAKHVSEFLGTDHTELYCSEQDLLSIVPEIPRIYDEPFADKSQIPTVMVSRLAREHVTVALSGDGGDELFGGYQRYARNAQIRRKVGLMPTFPFEVLASLYEGGAVSSPWLARKVDVGRFNNLEEFYRPRVAHLSDLTPLVPNVEETPWPTFPFSDALELSVVERLMLVDTMTYLPDDILVKVDRAAMSCSLETRAPLLNHRIAEFAWTLRYPDDSAANDAKWVLKSLLERRLPRQLFDRKKKGFSMPIGRWLKGELREWGGDIIFGEVARNFAEIDNRLVKRMWAEHQSGKRNWQSSLWDLIVFYAWLEHTAGGQGVAAA